MRMRNQFLVFAIVLLTYMSALAQGTPPAPAIPPSPPVVATPAQPDEPMSLSFYFDSSNYLGILPEEINSSNMSKYGLSAARGVGISRVTEGSPAEKAGLKKGDVILQFDGEPVTSTRKLFRLIGEAAPEQTVRLTVSRSGAEQQISVTLGQREDASRALGSLAPGLRDRLFQPRTPRALPTVPNLPNAPEVFSYSFGNNRRVGITTTQLTKQLADYFGVGGGQGLLITSVGENSPASKAGLKAGDVVTEVSGERIENAGDFTRALNRKDDGEVTLTIIRDRSRHTIKVTPERRQTPTFNLSEIQPAISRLITPQVKLQMPELRALELKLQGLQAMPRIENLVIPKINNLVIPRVILPRIEKLLKTPPEL